MRDFTARKNNTPLTVRYLREIVDYDPTMGVFTWKKPPSGMGKRISIGQKCGYESSNGYWEMGIKGESYRLHRLAWFYYYGKWSAHSVDHINRNRADNSIKNLRECSNGENRANSKVAKSSQSGLKGVKQVKGRMRWQARITVNKKRTYLGYFDCPKKAQEAYVIAAKKAFGEFYNCD